MPEVLPFAVTALALIAIPGPDFLYVLTRGVPAQLAVLALGFVASCAVFYSVVAATAGTIGDRLGRLPSMASAVRCISAVVLVGWAGGCCSTGGAEQAGGHRARPGEQAVAAGGAAAPA